MSPEDEQKLDDVLDKIDGLCEEVIQKARTRKKNGKPPTSEFSSKRFMETRERFETLSKDKALEESGEGGPRPPEATTARTPTTWFNWHRRAAKA